MRLLLILILVLTLPMNLIAQHEKPLIGINMDVATTSTGSINFSVRDTYVDSVIKAGGIPVVLPPLTNPEDIHRHVELVDGFVFIGGRDIDPARYGREPHPEHSPINPRRENYDFQLMEAALKADKPVLGVCLGMQELNVFSGGKMIQDLPTESNSELNHRPGLGGTHLAHDVEIAPGSRLHSILGAEKVPVNSLHHQACESTGPEAIVSARATDGTIEGIELPSKRFAVGVQWHPEYLSDDDTHLAIFRSLVIAAVETKALK